MANARDQYQYRRTKTALPRSTSTKPSKNIFTKRTSSIERKHDDASRKPYRGTAADSEIASDRPDSNEYVSSSEDWYSKPSSNTIRHRSHSKNAPNSTTFAAPSPSCDRFTHHRQVSAHQNTGRQTATDHCIHQGIENSRVNDRPTTLTRIDADNQFGLIILGNAGVGKSFLGNILLGQEAFYHQFSAGSITHNTEFFEIQIGDLVLAIFNIPGLIEADQKRIDLNKREIEKAFLARPNSIILYVFGNQRGRLRDEDIIAFNALNAAYSFRRESLVLALNDLDNDRPSDYEGTTMVLLQQLLPNVDVNERNVCFLNRINRKNSKEKQSLKEELLKVIVRFIPTIHKKKQEIQTTHDQLEAEKRKIQSQQEKFNSERSKFMEKIKKSQALLNETIANHQTEAESYQKAIQRQKRMLSKQQEQFERERHEHTSQLNALRSLANQTQIHHDELCREGKATSKILLEYEQKIDKMNMQIEELSRRLSTQGNKGSSCVIS